MSDAITRRSFIGATAAVVITPRSQSLHAEAAAPLPSADRRTLRAVMDVLIPADGRMPAGSALGGVAFIARVIATDAELRTGLAAGLAAIGARFSTAAPAAQVAAMTALERDNPAAFGLLRDLTYEAYYTHPKVWALLGYSFRSGPRPTASLEPFDERPLARVREMARLYREAD